MNADTQLFFISGAAGKLECALDLPRADPSGIVLIGLTLIRCMVER